ncbi:hypothetical protein CAEBREN_17459 [Caenorhabditis brenneri]|uniref:Sdz-33 F-box domain-containing protein n=1 Tax=Caenorhabditis brenneri TaxID=135651 RepID=G0N0D1_CAEBE|nr:hypothetical protein CAEBREN_17459 [Caenorhabditis brenneri]
MILQKFFPIDQLSIETRKFQDSKIPPSLLIQNHTYLDIRGANVPITLDELLLINSKAINIESLQIRPKEINKFIKLWQQGSNPRMEHLRFGYFDTEEAMKGIKHEVVPYNRRRLFKPTGLANPYEINGGLDIYRIDGVKATIKFEWDWNTSKSDMYVWFDHCVVES